MSCKSIPNNKYRKMLKSYLIEPVFEQPDAVVLQLTNLTIQVIIPFAQLFFAHLKIFFYT